MRAVFAILVFAELPDEMDLNVASEHITTAFEYSTARDALEAALDGVGIEVDHIHSGRDACLDVGS